MTAKYYVENIALYCVEKLWSRHKLLNISRAHRYINALIIIITIALIKQTLLYEKAL